MKTILVLTLALFTITSVTSQNIAESYNINLKKLPEYIIITSQNTKLLGGSGISIDVKKSKFKKELEHLVDVLQNRKKLKIRNQTDLLNAMYTIGFTYINSYNASQVKHAMDKDVFDDITNELLEGGTGSFRVNMIFKKISN